MLKTTRKKTNADLAASVLVYSFIKKIEEDNKTIVPTSFQAFNDPCLYRQRRYGWYAWLEYEDGTEIASSIDMRMDALENGMTDSDILSLILNHFAGYVYHGIKPIEDDIQFKEAESLLQQSH